MRKLASIQYVHDITPIEGADKIELIHVLGWQCVGGKDQFHVGDLVVYMEVDSFLPVTEDFEFLRKSSFKKNEILGEGFRLKTMRFRGQISQGLVMPVSFNKKLYDYVEELGNKSGYEKGTKEYNNSIIGTDVTELLGIRKWEIAETVTSAGTMIGTLPAWIFKTDETRVQSMPELIDEFRACGRYYISTKMDGTSVTMYLNEGKFGVCGHNYEMADDGKCDFWKYARKYDIEKKLCEAGYGCIAIQGEFCGAGIQGNKLKLKSPEWYVFTIQVDGKRVGLAEMKGICRKLGLTMVPIEEENDTFSYGSVDELLARADGKYSSGSKKEGIVIRPVEPVYSRLLSGSLSMKVINNSYLLQG